MVASGHFMIRLFARKVLWQSLTSRIVSGSLVSPLLDCDLVTLCTICTILFIVLEHFVLARRQLS